MPFELPPIETDPTAATARILDALQDRLPGWVPVEGAPEVALAEEIGRETAIVGQLASQMMTLSVAALGETGFGFPAYPGVPASIDVDITVTATGDVIPVGLVVTGLNPAGAEVAFALADEVTATSNPMPATLICTEVGDIGNAVPVGPLQVVTSTLTVVSVGATAASTGGADPETVLAYMDRLVDYLSTLRPGGVRAGDLAALARSVPGVHRALGVDLYDPIEETFDNERTATVYPIDENGAPVSPTVAAEVQALLEESREVNFVIHIAEPTYTAVAVEYEAVAETSADPAAVATNIENAIFNWLATWGTTEDDETAWEATNVVRYLEVARIAGSAAGVAYLSSLTVNGTTTDFTLPGVAPLPAAADDPTDPSTVTGTVL